MFLVEMELQKNLMIASENGHWPSQELCVWWGLHLPTSIVMALREIQQPLLTRTKPRFKITEDDDDKHVEK